MTAPRETSITINGHPCRVWEKGDGPPIGYLPGAPGLMRWTPFLERLSVHRHVIAPSIPGFLGADGHRLLDDLADWVAATLDLLEGAGLDGADLIGASVGGALAAEVAAFSRPTVDRLILISPYGLCDPDEPVTDVFATKPGTQPELVSANTEALTAALAAPEGDDDLAQELPILLYRAQEAAARFVWPFGDRGLAKRLHRITAPTLLIWGTEDQVIPASYAKRFAEGIRGEAEICSIEGAGHTAEIDAPDAVADAILSFLSKSA
jgi:pimeloyl-ACP methyl ester carboxylesterase